jgi:hypothetical protein
MEMPRSRFFWISITRMTNHQGRKAQGRSFERFLPVRKRIAARVKRSPHACTHVSKQVGIRVRKEDRRQDSVGYEILQADKNLQFPNLNSGGSLMVFFRG